MKEFEKRKKLKDIEGKFNLGNACSSGDLHRSYPG